MQEVDESAIVEAQAIWKKGIYSVERCTVRGVRECVYTGDQLNRQHVPSVDHSELARETERLDREYAASAMT